MTIFIFLVGLAIGAFLPLLHDLIEHIRYIAFKSLRERIYD